MLQVAFVYLNPAGVSASLMLMLCLFIQVFLYLSALTIVLYAYLDIYLFSKHKCVISNVLFVEFLNISVIDTRLCLLQTNESMVEIISSLCFVPFYAFHVS